MKIIFLFVLFSQNNIFLTLTNNKGQVIYWKSLGSFKVKGLKKLNSSLLKPFIYKNLNFLKLINTSFKFKVYVKVKGLNKFKKIFLRTLLIFLDNSLLSFEDSLLQPSNGCKLKKKKRL